jgi:type I restriction enzyme M protein
MAELELVDSSEVPEPPAPKRGRKAAGSNGNNGKGDLGFEATLWAAADKLRGNLDSSEYKHVVLGLIFLKYVSDAFEERHDAVLREVSDPASGSYLAEERARYDAVEERDEYLAENVFWVPQEARWSLLQGKAKLPEIGSALDAAMDAIERDNPRLKGVLPKEYGRPTLDKRRLGELIDLIGTIGLGDAANRSKDILGRVYEYFLSQFASAEGKKGGEFYTPRPVVRLLVEMLEPKPGKRIYDPCCGSGGMFVQSEKFVEEHGGRLGDVSIFGQESNPTTWKMCQMNLAIRGIDAKIELGDTFHDDKLKDVRADYILANPPFNVSDWGGASVRDDVRWKYGAPPVGNANFAWVQHFIHHLSPTGTAGFVLANGSMASNQSGEGEIRKAIIEADLVDCMVALPGQLFYSTQIPVCLWFLARNKRNSSFRDRRRQTLFIDARKLGTMTDRTHLELTEDDIARVAKTYHAWRGEPEAGRYADVAGFCKSATTEEIAGHGYVLTPGRYVGAEDAEEDAEPFEEKMQRLAAKLEEQFSEGARLESAIRQNLKEFALGS